MCEKYFLLIGCKDNIIFFTVIKFLGEKGVNFLVCYLLVKSFYLS